MTTGAKVALFHEAPGSTSMPHQDASASHLPTSFLVQFTQEYSGHGQTESRHSIHFHTELNQPLPASFKHWQLGLQGPAGSVFQDAPN